MQGNQLVTDAGLPLRLVGVNRASLEYRCVEPLSYGSHRYYDGPIDDQAIAAIASWNANAVRVPLNEQCWLGVNPVRQKANKIVRLHGAAARRAAKRLRTRYRRIVTGLVKRLNAHGLVVILDLHWSAPGRVLADGQRRAPDASHAIDFWRSVARTFRPNSSVIFDLFNEPLGVSWRCLRDGGCKPKASCIDEQTPRCTRITRRYKAAGMQQLVNVIRGTGAPQPLMIPGLFYSHNLERWLEFVPHDPLAATPAGRQIVASFHNYGQNDSDASRFCARACWDRVIAPIASQYPVVTGEFGQFDCGSGYVTDFMTWADAHGLSYLAWWWYEDFRGCNLELIEDFTTGRPTAYGQAFHDHYHAVG